MKKSGSFKMLAVAAAGGCLLVASPLVSAAASATGAAETAATASASPATSAVSAAAVTVTAKHVSESTDQYTADLQIPVLSGMADAQYQAQLNDLLESRATDNLDTLKKEAAEDAAAAQTDGYPFRPHELKVTYDLKSDGSGPSGQLSLVVTTYTFSGGAHGATVEDTYNVQNDAEAAPLTLEQLLGSDYLAIANKAVTDALQADPDKFYPQDGSDAFKSITDDQSFFISDGTVNLVFQQYDIAPYASGIIEIPIKDQSVSKPAEPPKKTSLTLSPATANEAGDAHYFVDANGHAMVPLRAVAAGFGYKVTWDNSSKTAKLTSEAHTASAQLGHTGYVLDQNAPLELAAAPVNVGGTLYVPDIFFAKILGLNVTDSPTGGNITLHN